MPPILPAGSDKNPARDSPDESGPPYRMNGPSICRKGDYGDMDSRNEVPDGQARPYRHRSGAKSAEFMEVARKLPPIDYEEMRREADEFFGIDRVDHDPWERCGG